MTRPGSIFSIAKTWVVRLPQDTHCIPHHWIALTLCCAEDTFNLAHLSHRWLKPYLFLHPFVPKCPDSPFVLTATPSFFHWAELEPWKGFSEECARSVCTVPTQRRGRGQRDITHYTGAEVWRNIPPCFDQRNSSPPWDPYTEQIKPTDHKQKCTFGRQNIR